MKSELTLFNDKFSCNIPSYIEIFEIKEEATQTKIICKNTRAVSIGEVKAYFLSIYLFNKKDVSINSEKFNISGKLNNIKQANKKIILTIQK